MSGLRFLHLSDLHAGQPGEKTRWPTAKEPFLADLRALCQKEGPPHFIVVTGDLAFSGHKREYEAARTVMDEIDEATGAFPMWIAVPGNHDLRWPTRGDAMAKGLKSYDEDLSVRRAVHSSSDTSRTVGKLFSNYQQFFRDRILAGWHARKNEWQVDWTLGQLPGNFVVCLTCAGFRLGVVGLNTAFLQLDDGDYEGHLCVEPEQLPTAVPTFLETCDAALLVMHHPPSWLTKRSSVLFEQDVFPPGRFVACLFGHMHRPRAQSTLGSSGKSRLFLQGPSLFGLEHYGHKNEERATGYGFYKLQRTSDGEGELLRQVRTARFLDDGALSLWADPATGPGGISFRVPLLKTARLQKKTPTAAPRLSLSLPTGDNPFAHRGRIVDPGEFVGRKVLLRQLLADLPRGISRALIGAAQMGKTSVLSVLCALWSAQHPQVTPVYLNLQIVNDDSDFFDALCHSLSIPVSRGYKLERQLRGRKVLLCLDEVERLRNDRFPMEVREQLRGLSDGSDAPMALLLASRHPLVDLFPDAHAQTSPLYNLCSPIALLPFSDEECRELITSRLRGASVQFSEEDIAALTKKSAGHPATLLAESAALFDARKGRP
jgi:type II secretory pathway predicted ATPase ExeA